MGRWVGGIVTLTLFACGSMTNLDGGQDASDAADAGATEGAADAAIDVVFGMDASDGGLVTLVAGFGGARSLAVDSTTLYWAAGGTINTCSKSACQPPFPQPVYNQAGNVDNLVLDGGYLYFTTGSGDIARCATNSVCGPSPTALMTVQYNVTSLAVRAGNAYWNTLHAILTCDATDIATCQNTMRTIASGAIQPAKLAVDDTNVYWSDIGSGGTNGAKIFSCPLVGCTTPAPLVTGIPNVGEIGLSPTSVLWRMTNNTSGSLVSCAKTGCSGAPPTVGASAPIVGVPLLIDGTNAYWSTATLQIVRCNGLSCMNGADVVAENHQANWAMVADDTSLYWIEADGTIARLTPK
jgi:hypothetical protein